MSERKIVSFADGVETGVDPRLLKRIAPGEDIFTLEDEDAPRPKKTKEEEEEDDLKEKHTLDSDEEDEEDHKKMDIRKVDGQEDSTLDFDGQIKITPFNMKEDEEEGHFDSEGNFVFEKKEELKDAWLDGIDWGNVKRKAGDHWEVSNEDQDGDEPLPAALDDIRRKEIFRKLIELLKPGQSVTKAMATIRKTKLTAAEERKLRWAAKKAGTTMEVDDGQKKTVELSGLADELISAGHMDAYEWNREKVEYLLSRLESVATDALDMFSDEPTESAAGSSSAAAEAAAAMDDTVMWEYKESDDGELQGPFSSEVMARRQGEGKMGPKSLARKVGSGDFNPTARVDFDLYC